MYLYVYIEVYLRGLVKYQVWWEMSLPMAGVGIR